ncbi:hypothetical protein YC2023_073630 [Brassica napus]
MEQQQNIVGLYPEGSPSRNSQRPRSSLETMRGFGNSFQPAIDAPRLLRHCPKRKDEFQQSNTSFFYSLDKTNLLDMHFRCGSVDFSDQIRAARTQAPSATNNDAGSPTWGDLKLSAPPQSAMEATHLHDHELTPSSENDLKEPMDGTSNITSKTSFKGCGVDSHLRYCVF